MNKQEIFDYLKDNLKIELTVTPEGMTWPLNVVKVKLLLKSPDGKELVNIAEGEDSFSTM
jgi:hypothetical protein